MTVKNQELYVGNYRLGELAETYKTPLYVYDEVGILDKIDTFITNFYSEKFTCEVIYASKAFLAPHMCKILAEHKIGIDAVSAGDLYIINKSGFPMNRVVLHGNNKSEEELAMALDYGVEYIVVDSLTEVTRLERLTSEKNKSITTLLRVNPGIHADTHAYIETSLLSSKFGESIHDEEILSKIVAIYKNSKYLKFDGLHAHIGSQISNPKSFVAETKTMLNFIRRFQEKYQLSVRTLNLGGGFGIKYRDDDNEINLPIMLKEIIRYAETGIAKNNLQIAKLMIEPGRSIVGDSGFTLYQCGGMKTSFGGKKYLFVDGGMADNIRPALYQAKYTVEVANRIIEKSEDEDEDYNLMNFCDVVGKCCESGDIVAENVNIGEVHKGDIIIVYATGAYCYSMSMNYNGLVRGAVIFVNKDKVTVAIDRQTYENLASTYRF
jgi:diaminopimelate decarboxylase